MTAKVVLCGVDRPVSPSCRRAVVSGCAADAARGGARRRRLRRHPAAGVLPAEGTLPAVGWLLRGCQACCLTAALFNDPSWMLKPQILHARLNPKVLVGDRATWKSPDHPFRKDPKLQLTGDASPLGSRTVLPPACRTTSLGVTNLCNSHCAGIPTVMIWTADGAGQRLGASQTALAHRLLRRSHVWWWF